MGTRKGKSTLTAEQAIKEIQRIGPIVEQLRDRVMYVERVCRVLGEYYTASHLTEAQLKNSARRANHLYNAVTAVKGNLKRHGSEFDREPYIENPEG